MHQSACAEAGIGFHIFRLLLIYLGLCSEAKAFDLILSRKAVFPPTQLVSGAEVSLVSNHWKGDLFSSWHCEHDVLLDGQFDHHFLNGFRWTPLYLLGTVNSLEVSSLLLCVFTICVKPQLHLWCVLLKVTLRCFICKQSFILHWASFTHLSVAWRSNRLVKCISFLIHYRQSHLKKMKPVFSHPYLLFNNLPLSCWSFAVCFLAHYRHL